MVAVLLPTVFQTKMPRTTAEVMQLFNGMCEGGGPDGLATSLLESIGPDALYGEPNATDLEFRLFSELLHSLLAADPAKRPTAEATSEHPFFSTVQVEQASHKPTTTPVAVGQSGECLTYRVHHGGEAATEATWESLHFNEAAVQFHLMLGGSGRVSVQEVLVCINESSRTRFEAKREALAAANKPTEEIWVRGKGKGCS
jgi:hypothetical protein